MFKTIPVTAITRVTDVIQIALEKFGLKVWSLAKNALSCHNTWISHVTTDDWKSREGHNPPLYLGLDTGVWYVWPPWILLWCPPSPGQGSWASPSQSHCLLWTAVPRLRRLFCFWCRTLLGWGTRNNPYNEHPGITRDILHLIVAVEWVEQVINITCSVPNYFGFL